jgi:hypothetical protein
VQRHKPLLDHLLPEHGYTIHRIRIDDQLRNKGGNISWKAAYGLYLMRGCKMAIEAAEACGHFVPFEPLSEGEFKALRKSRMSPWSARR